MSKKTMIILQGSIAFVALILMWRENFSYMSSNFKESNLQFWRDTWVTPASRSITIDIFALYVSVFVWKFTDAKNIGLVKYLPIFLVFGMLIGVSVTTPIYFIHRILDQRKL